MTQHPTTLSDRLRPALLGCVFAGGTIGTLARWIANELFPAGNLPWGTLVVNLSGAFLLGAVIGWFAADAARPLWAKLVLGTGFCGAFTTYSAFAYELVAMVGEGRLLVAAGYATVSIVAGLVLGWLGHRVAGRR